MKPLLCAVLVAFGCCARVSARPSVAGEVPAAQRAQAVHGSNAFATDLFRRLRVQPGNLFFSPESITTAFAMAYAGARGQTAAEMARVFHFTLAREQLEPAMGALLAGMNARHQGYTLRVADALWAQQDSNFLPSYLHLVQIDYGADFHPVDFKTSPESVRSTINQWVEQQTGDKIKDLIAPGVLTPSTRLVFTNAIYFKGDWLSQFRKSNTGQEEFHLSASKSIKTAMMHRTGGYRYYDGGTFQELELPYQGNALVMDILLPKQIGGLPELEGSFTAAALDGWLRRLEPADSVILSLPRFTMTRQFELGGVLKRMGMAQAFSGAADFSGMTGKPDFSISAVIHKAYIDVSETGTEAAAATAPIMTATAMRNSLLQPPPIVFRADHPFLFLIRDTDTGAILFMGRLADPGK